MKWSAFTSKACRESEDVKKRLRLVSEVRLSLREVKPCGLVRHALFQVDFAKKRFFDGLCRE